MNIFTRLFKENLKINWIKREIRLRFGRHSTVRVAIDGEVLCVHDISLTGIGLYCDKKESKQTTDILKNGLPPHRYAVIDGTEVKVVLSNVSGTGLVLDGISDKVGEILGNDEKPATDEEAGAAARQQQSQNRIEGQTNS